MFRKQQYLLNFIVNVQYKTHSNILMSFNFVCCVVCVFCFCFLCSAALLKCVLWYLFRNTGFSEKRYRNISAAETWHSCADTEWARGWFKYHVLCFCHWAKPAAFSNEHWQERMWEHPRSLFCSLLENHIPKSLRSTPRIPPFFLFNNYFQCLSF